MVTAVMSVPGLRFTLSTFLRPSTHYLQADHKGLLPLWPCQSQSCLLLPRLLETRSVKCSLQTLFTSLSTICVKQALSSGLNPLQEDRNAERLASASEVWQGCGPHWEKMDHHEHQAYNYKHTLSYLRAFIYFFCPGKLTAEAVSLAHPK